MQHGNEKIDQLTNENRELAARHAEELKSMNAQYEEKIFKARLDHLKQVAELKNKRVKELSCLLKKVSFISAEN